MSDTVPQMPSTPELQEALSGVPPRLWAKRLERRVDRARAAGQPSLEVPEFADAGVLMWHIDMAGAGSVSLAAWGAAKPTRSRWRLRLRRWLGRTVFAPHVDTGTAGEHHWGEISAVGLFAIAGTLTGGWAIRGSLPVVYGGLIGAAAGWVGWFAFLFAARRRVVGRPVDVTDPELMSLVVQLDETGFRARGLDFPDPSLDVAWTVRELTYQLVDNALSTEEFIRLRYQAQMLDHAVGQALRAQSTLDTITSVPSTPADITPAVAAAADRTAAVTDRLTAHTAAMDEVAGQIRTIRRSWPAAS